MQMKLNNVQGFIYSLSQKQLIETPPNSSRGSKKPEVTTKPLAIAAGGFSNKQVRPEPKTENQLLKILNRQYMESSVFEGINKRNLPDYIIKDTHNSS